MSLIEKVSAYDEVSQRFGFLCKLENLSDTDLCCAAHNLVKISKANLEPSLGDELVQSAAIINLYKEDC
jgi:hypothetical protein